MHLIGLHGRAQVGKDTVANYLALQHGFAKTSFAGPLKSAAAVMFNLTDEQRLEQNKEVVIPYWGISPRTMYQKLGTEGGRNLFGTDLWLKRWKLEALDLLAKQPVVVSDVRFDNEADIIRNMGGTIVHIKSHRASPLTTTAKAHASEAGIEFCVATDLQISNDGSYEELYTQVDRVMNYLNGMIEPGSRLA